MKDIVIIPAYMRPEFLHLCLEWLSKADGAKDDKQYWVMQDMKFEDDCRNGIALRWTKEVIENSSLPVRYVERKPHGFAGNSYNTLEAYKEAFETNARYVHLVEEDCLVAPDYFRWHEAVQEKEPSTMCSIAYRCARNSDAFKDITDPAAYFVSARDYASIGVCWRREELGPVIVHAVPDYYSNNGPYLDSRFPEDMYSGWYHEQDGAIMRVMHSQKKFTVWSYVPRIFHVGNIGYHRPSGIRGNGQLQNKIDFLRGWIHDAERIKEVAPDFGDIEPVPIGPAPVWSPADLHKEQHFE